MRRLIHEAQERAAQEELERNLLQGLDSGEPIENTPKDWKRMRGELIERHRPSPT